MARRKRGKRSPHVPFRQSTALANDEPRSFRLHHGKSDLWLLAFLAALFLAGTVYPTVWAVVDWIQLAIQVAAPLTFIILTVRQEGEAIFDPHVPALAGAAYLGLVAHSAVSGDADWRDAVAVVAGVLWLVFAGLAWSRR